MTAGTLAAYIRSLNPRPVALRLHPDDFQSVVEDATLADMILPGQIVDYSRRSLLQGTRFCGVKLIESDTCLPEPVYDE